MSPNSQNSGASNLLGSFISLLGVFGIFLYFLGWIYRWAYFGFFQLHITSLNFPIESFFIVPIQAILGDFWIFVRASLVLIITVVLIKVTHWLIRDYNKVIFLKKCHPLIKEIPKKLHKFWLVKSLRSLAGFLPLPLIDEMIVVAWILAALFWLGRWQGTADAYRDAVNTTSTRPIATLVSPSDKIALGRYLDDLLPNPSLKGSRIIGDVKQFMQIYGRETNDTINPKQPIVWRLLIENDNWIYLFPAMPSKAKSNQRPPLLAVNKADGQVQLLILGLPKVSN